MNQVAVFIDAGYFWVQSGHVVHGSKVSREQVSIDYAVLRQEVLDHVKAQFPSANLLRVYWYDGPGAQGNKTPAHHAIDELDDFKLRLGSRNGYGDQKAVDGLIIADLIGLAQSKAITGALLLSGDADLTPGVTTAQGLGIRVHLLSMGPKTATSPILRTEVDYKAHWSDPTVKKFATAKVATSPVEGVTAPSMPDCGSNASETTDVYRNVACQVLQAIGHPDRPVVLENGYIPKTADSRLLWAGKQQFGRDLTETEKRALRKVFKVLLSSQLE